MTRLETEIILILALFSAVSLFCRERASADAKKVKVPVSKKHPVALQNARALQKKSSVPAEAGKAVNGLQLIMLTPPEAWYAVGDGIRVRALIKNISGKDLSVLLAYRFPLSLTVIDENGIICPANMMMYRCDKNPGPMWHDIQAGENKVIDLDLRYMIRIPKPGTYTLWTLLNSIKGFKHWRKPKKTPWHGKLCSNPVTIKVISQEKYKKRASGPISSGKCKGISLQLKSGAETYGLGKPLRLSAEFRNGADNPVTLDFADQLRIIRVKKDGSLATVWNAWAAKRTLNKDRFCITIKPGTSESFDLSFGFTREHMRAGAEGELTYRAELWLRHPLDKAEKGNPLEPVRTISPDIKLQIDITENDLDRLLNEAAKEWNKGRRKQNRISALNTMCSYLDRIGPWLGKRVLQDDTAGSIASDLFLAYNMKKAYSSKNVSRSAYDIHIDGKGQFVFKPEQIGRLAGIGSKSGEAHRFAKAFVRLKRCASYIRSGTAQSIHAELETPMKDILALARAVTEQASREKVYIHRLNMKFDTKGPGPYSKGILKHRGLPLTDANSFNLVVGIGRAGDKPVFYAVPHPKPDPHPSYYKGWHHKKELPGVIAGLKNSPDRFESREDFAAFMAKREKRHTQAWLISLEGALWRDVRDAAYVLMAWNPGISLSIAKDPDAFMRPRHKDPGTSPKPKEDEIEDIF